MVLDKPLFITGGATLTILPGVTVRGNPRSAAVTAGQAGGTPGVLIATRSGKFDWQGDGTPSGVIIMTTAAVDNNNDKQPDDFDGNGFEDAYPGYDPALSGAIPGTLPCTCGNNGTPAHSRRRLPRDRPDPGNRGRRAGQLRGRRDARLPRRRSARRAAGAADAADQPGPGPRAGRHQRHRRRRRRRRQRRPLGRRRDARQGAHQHRRRLDGGRGGRRRRHRRGLHRSGLPGGAGDLRRRPAARQLRHRPVRVGAPRRRRDRHLERAERLHHGRRRRRHRLRPQRGLRQLRRRLRVVRRNRELRPPDGVAHR